MASWRKLLLLPDEDPERLTPSQEPFADAQQHENENDEPRAQGNRGKQSQSIEPSHATSAAVLQSPIIA
jgi:hypothetical protein